MSEVECKAAEMSEDGNCSESISWAPERTPSAGVGVTTALAAVLIFTIVVDILGNVLVIIAVFRNRKLRNPDRVKVFDKAVPNLLCLPDEEEAVLGALDTVDDLNRLTGNIFVVSLSVADLVVALYPYPLILFAIFQDGWTLGDIHCQVSGFLMGLSVIGSVFNITAIAINRYCYICHSFRYEKLFSYKHTICYLCLTWLLTVIAIIPNFFVNSLKYDPRVFSCTFTQTVSSYYTIAVVVVHFLVPIGVVTYCYLRIWILVIQVKRRVRPDEPKLKSSDFRNFLTMFVVFVLFAVCWGPLNFIGLAVAINPPAVAHKIPEWLFIMSYFMAYFNSCLNAIIYGLLNQNFRSEYKRILLSLWSPRLFFSDLSKIGTDAVRSKPSPVPTNNNVAEENV